MGRGGCAAGARCDQGTGVDGAGAAMQRHGGTDVVALRERVVVQLGHMARWLGYGEVGTVE